MKKRVYLLPDFLDEFATFERFLLRAELDENLFNPVLSKELIQLRR